MMKEDANASKVFKIIRIYAEINKDIQEVFKKHKLDEEEKLLVLSIIAEEMMGKEKKI